MIKKIMVFCLFTMCWSGADSFGKVFDLPEGADCSWEGRNGKCANIKSCPSAIDAIKKKMHPPICSFQGKAPIVCCASKKCLPNIPAPIDVDDFDIDERFNFTSKAGDHCLKFLRTLDYQCSFSQLRSLSDNDCEDETPMDDSDDISSFARSSGPVKRDTSNQSDDFWADHGLPVDAPAIGHGAPVIGHGVPALRNQYPHMIPIYPPPAIPYSVSAGKPAIRNQYPHMALLGYGDDIPTAQWLCGGSVISKNYILTAAHCVSSPAVGPVKFVALGILKRSDSPEYWQTHIVKRVIPHPEYQPPSKYNDIALLETEDTISFSINVLPACLHLVPDSDETAEATGWGSTGHRQGLADTLQTVKLQRYDEEKCSELYPVHRHLQAGYNHSSQMCYGDKEEPKDTCEGDSGGPLQVANQVHRCAYTILGVTSYGRQCGISAGSGMYTRVYYYVPWIESIVWP